MDHCIFATPTFNNLLLTMNPMLIESGDELREVLNDLPFINQINTRSLYPQYKALQDFAFATLMESAKSGSDDDGLTSTRHILKQFVHNDRHDNHCAELIRLMSFCVCFPVSEAIVESWGSTISHLYAIKHNPKEPSDDLLETGTIDKLTFIRLCGPPPGMKNNRKLFKCVLMDHFKCSDFGKHFANTTKFERVTSKVVERIITPDTSNILPCFI